MSSHHGASSSEWKAFLAEHSDGGTLSATVVSVEPFGAFLEVAPGIHGLLPRPEWSEEPETGSTMSVRILDVDLERRRMSLAPA